MKLINFTQKSNFLYFKQSQNQFFYSKKLVIKNLLALNFQYYQKYDKGYISICGVLKQTIWNSIYLGNQLIFFFLNTKLIHVICNFSTNIIKKIMLNFQYIKLKISWKRWTKKKIFFYTDYLLSGSLITSTDEYISSGGIFSSFSDSYLSYTELPSTHGALDFYPISWQNSVDLTFLFFKGLDTQNWEIYNTFSNPNELPSLLQNVLPLYWQTRILKNDFTKSYYLINDSKFFFESFYLEFYWFLLQKIKEDSLFLQKFEIALLKKDTEFLTLIFQNFIFCYMTHTVKIMTKSQGFEETFPFTSSLTFWETLDWKLFNSLYYYDLRILNCTDISTEIFLDRVLQFITGVNFFFLYNLFTSPLPEQFVRNIGASVLNEPMISDFPDHVFFGLLFIPMLLSLWIYYFFNNKNLLFFLNYFELQFLKIKKQSHFSLFSMHKLLLPTSHFWEEEMEETYWEVFESGTDDEEQTTTSNFDTSDDSSEGEDDDTQNLDEYDLISHHFLHELLFHQFQFFFTGFRFGGYNLEKTFSRTFALSHIHYYLLGETFLPILKLFFDSEQIDDILTRASLAEGDYDFNIEASQEGIWMWQKYGAGVYALPYLIYQTVWELMDIVITEKISDVDETEFNEAFGYEDFYNPYYFSNLVKKKKFYVYDNEEELTFYEFLGILTFITLVQMEIYHPMTYYGFDEENEAMQLTYLERFVPLLNETPEALVTLLLDSFELADSTEYSDSISFIAVSSWHSDYDEMEYYNMPFIETALQSGEPDEDEEVDHVFYWDFDDFDDDMSCELEIVGFINASNTIDNFLEDYSVAGFGDVLNLGFIFDLFESYQWNSLQQFAPVGNLNTTPCYRFAYQPFDPSYGANPHKDFKLDLHFLDTDLYVNPIFISLGGPDEDLEFQHQTYSGMASLEEISQLGENYFFFENDPLLAIRTYVYDLFGDDKKPKVPMPSFNSIALNHESMGSVISWVDHDLNEYADSAVVHGLKYFPFDLPLFSSFFFDAIFDKQDLQLNKTEFLTPLRFFFEIHDEDIPDFLKPSFGYYSEQFGVSGFNELRYFTQKQNWNYSELFTKHSDFYNWLNMRILTTIQMIPIFQGLNEKNTINEVPNYYKKFTRTKTSEIFLLFLARNKTFWLSNPYNITAFRKLLPFTTFYTTRELFLKFWELAGTLPTETITQLNKLDFFFFLANSPKITRSQLLYFFDGKINQKINLMCEKLSERKKFQPRPKLTFTLHDRMVGNDLIHRMLDELQEVAGITGATIQSKHNRFFLDILNDMPSIGLHGPIHFPLTVDRSEQIFDIPQWLRYNNLQFFGRNDEISDLWEFEDWWLEPEEEDIQLWSKWKNLIDQRELKLANMSGFHDYFNYFDLNLQPMLAPRLIPTISVDYFIQQPVHLLFGYTYFYLKTPYLLSDYDRVYNTFLDDLVNYEDELGVLPELYSFDYAKDLKFFINNISPKNEHEFDQFHEFPIEIQKKPDEILDHESEFWEEEDIGSFLLPAVPDAEDSMAVGDAKELVDYYYYFISGLNAPRIGHSLIFEETIQGLFAQSLHEELTEPIIRRTEPLFLTKRVPEEFVDGFNYSDTGQEFVPYMYEFYKNLYQCDPNLEVDFWDRLNLKQYFDEKAFYVSFTPNLVMPESLSAHEIYYFDLVDQTRPNFWYLNKDKHYSLKTSSNFFDKHDSMVTMWDWRLTDSAMLNYFERLSVQEAYNPETNFYLQTAYLRHWFIQPIKTIMQNDKFIHRFSFFENSHTKHEMVTSNYFYLFFKAYLNVSSIKPPIRLQNLFFYCMDIFVLRIFFFFFFSYQKLTQLYNFYSNYYYLFLFTYVSTSYEIFVRIFEIGQLIFKYIYFALVLRWYRGLEFIFAYVFYNFIFLWGYILLGLKFCYFGCYSIIKYIIILVTPIWTIIESSLNLIDYWFIFITYFQNLIYLHFTKVNYLFMQKWKFFYVLVTDFDWEEILVKKHNNFELTFYLIFINCIKSFHFLITFSKWCWTSYDITTFDKFVISQYLLLNTKTLPISYLNNFSLRTEEHRENDAIFEDLKAVWIFQFFGRFFDFRLTQRGIDLCSILYELTMLMVWGFYLFHFSYTGVCFLIRDWLINFFYFLNEGYFARHNWPRFVGWYDNLNSFSLRFPSAHIYEVYTRWLLRQELLLNPHDREWLGQQFWPGGQMYFKNGEVSDMVHDNFYDGGYPKYPDQTRDDVYFTDAFTALTQPEYDNDELDQVEKSPFLYFNKLSYTLNPKAFFALNGFQKNYEKHNIMYTINNVSGLEWLANYRLFKKLIKKTKTQKQQLLTIDTFYKPLFLYLLDPQFTQKKFHFSLMINYWQKLWHDRGLIALRSFNSVLLDKTFVNLLLNPLNLQTLQNSRYQIKKVFNIFYNEDLETENTLKIFFKTNKPLGIGLRVSPYMSIFKEGPDDDELFAMGSTFAGDPDDRDNFINNIFFQNISQFEIFNRFNSHERARVDEEHAGWLWRSSFLTKYLVNDSPNALIYVDPYHFIFPDFLNHQLTPTYTFFQTLGLFNRQNSDFVKFPILEENMRLAPRYQKTNQWVEMTNEKINDAYMLFNRVWDTRPYIAPQFNITLPVDNELMRGLMYIPNLMYWEETEDEDSEYFEDWYYNEYENTDLGFFVEMDMSRVGLDEFNEMFVTPLELSFDWTFPDVMARDAIDMLEVQKAYPGLDDHVTKTKMLRFHEISFYTEDDYFELEDDDMMDWFEEMEALIPFLELEWCEIAPKTDVQWDSDMVPFDAMEILTTEQFSRTFPELAAFRLNDVVTTTYLTGYKTFQNSFFNKNQKKYLDKNVFLIDRVFSLKYPLYQVDNFGILKEFLLGYDFSHFIGIPQNLNNSWSTHHQVLSPGLALPQHYMLTMSDYNNLVNNGEWKPDYNESEDFFNMAQLENEQNMFYPNTTRLYQFVKRLLKDTTFEKYMNGFFMEEQKILLTQMLDDSEQLKNFFSYFYLYYIYYYYIHCFKFFVILRLCFLCLMNWWGYLHFFDFLVYLLPPTNLPLLSEKEIEKVK